MLRTASLAALMAAGLVLPAAAEITAEELWSDWQSDAEAGGTMTAANETREGDVLRLEGVTARFDMQGSSTTAMIDWVELADQDDGTVRVSSAPVYRLRLEDPPRPDGEALVIEGTLRHDGAVTTVSRDDGVFAYRTVAPEIVLLFEDIPSSDAGGTTDATMTATDLDLRTGGGMPDAAMPVEMSAGDLAIDLVGEDVDQGFHLTGRYTGLEGRSEGLAEAFGGGGTMRPADAAALDFTAELSHRGSRTRLEVSEADGVTEAETHSAEGRVAIAAADGTGHYDARIRSTDLVLSGDRIPIPDATARIEAVDVAIAMPIAPAETPAPFSLSYDVSGLSVSDQVWDLFDPNRAIPREPASLALEATGEGRLMRDLTAAPPPGARDPGFVVASLDLGRLLVSALGVELTGEGALDFGDDPSMLAPDGQIDLRLEGADGLLDTLLDLGVYPPGQILGLRTGLGMFSTPVEGEDAVTSTLRFGPDGRIEVNGTRIR